LNYLVECAPRKRQAFRTRDLQLGSYDLQLGSYWRG
jgi:hypothetical protein